MRKGLFVGGLGRDFDSCSFSAVCSQDPFHCYDTPTSVFPGAVAALTPRRSHSSHLKSPAAVNGQERDMETTEETNPERRAGRKTPSLFSLPSQGETPADAADTKRRQRVISVAGP